MFVTNALWLILPTFFSRPFFKYVVSINIINVVFRVIPFLYYKIFVVRILIFL